MSDARGAPRGTRAWLKRELATWRSEGLVDERAAQELERRYGLAEGAGIPASLFAVYLVGSMLIGGGVISFVAWNWDRLPGAAKLALGAAALVAAYGAGHWMGQASRRPLLGRALVFLGSLLFGANIGLVAQVFQRGGEFDEAAGLWAAGAALAAWLLDNTPSGLLAAGLGVAWTGGRIADGGNLWAPFLPALVLVPLAFRQRSPVLFASTLAAFFGTLAYAAGAASDQGEIAVASGLASSGFVLALSYVLERGYPAFASAARRLGTLVVVFFSYGLSFHEAAGEMSIPWNARAWGVAVLPPLAGLAVCLALTARAHPGDFRERPFAALELAAAALVFAGTLLRDPEVPLAILANLSVCSSAGYGLVTAVRSLERRGYWASVGLLLLVIVSRFLEYETGLLLKAGVFTISGAAVLVLGLSFERRVRAREAGGA